MKREMFVLLALGIVLHRAEESEGGVELPVTLRPAPGRLCPGQRGGRARREDGDKRV